MTEVEVQALALVNEVCAERRTYWGLDVDRASGIQAEALCRAVERHEAFRRDVSDAMQTVVDYYRVSPGIEIAHVQLADGRSVTFSDFIIAKPDPLVEALSECLSSDECMIEPAERLRKALAARGLEIVEKKP